MGVKSRGSWSVGICLRKPNCMGRCGKCIRFSEYHENLIKQYRDSDDSPLPYTSPDLDAWFDGYASMMLKARRKALVKIWRDYGKSLRAVEK